VSRPCIGITVDVDDAGRLFSPRSYADAVVAGGGLPLLVPHADALAEEHLSRLHGLLITGGAFDVSPGLYGEARRPACGPEKPDRTRSELALLVAALSAGLPVLGVCGGMQLMAVALKGALYQDLLADAGLSGHEQPAPKDLPSHPVEIAPGTRLATLVGTAPLPVNSTHHQAVRTPGPGVVVSARAPDGVIEAIELPVPAFVLGVQWHPEVALRHEPRHAEIYRGLVEAAAAFAAGGGQ
jgi:putative glutamine amidotransferase